MNKYSYKKSILIVFILIFLVLVLGVVFLKIGDTLPEHNQQKEEQKITLFGDISNFLPNSLEIKLNENEFIRKEAWNVFSKYINASKEKDLETVTALSYNLSDACLDESRREECNLLMSGVVEATIDFKEKQFSQIWFDDKQAVLFTDLKRIDEGDIVKYKKSYIFFSRDGQSDLKLLGIDLGQVWSFDKGPNSYTEEEIEKELQSIITDTDKDTIPDIYEVCEELSEVCEGETKPQTRDTDGDGWWDGVEFYLSR